jgi:hypothetical protein
MARVQQKSNNKKKPANQYTKKVDQKKSDSQKVDLVKTKPQKEASKNEILFYRIGMSLVVLTIITVAIIFTVRYFMNQEEENQVYEDYIHITQMDLMYLTYDDGSGVYGDFSYFSGLTGYDELVEAIYSNNIIYVYFYRSSNVNEDIKNKIESMDLEGKAFFLLNLDNPRNANVLEMSELMHLNLQTNRDNMLLIFDIDLQEFNLEFRVSDILVALNKI